MMLCRPKRALGANLIIFGLQLGSQNPPKIHFFPPQDVSYLEIREKPKFCESSKDLPHFCCLEWGWGGGVGWGGEGVTIRGQNY